MQYPLQKIAIISLEVSATLWFSLFFHRKRDSNESLATCMNNLNLFVFNLTISHIFIVTQRSYNNLITYKNHLKLRKTNFKYLKKNHVRLLLWKYLSKTDTRNFLHHFQIMASFFHKICTHMKCLFIIIYEHKPLSIFLIFLAHKLILRNYHHREKCQIQHKQFCPLVAPEVLCHIGWRLLHT